MTRPTDPAAAMREAAAKLVEESFDKPQSIPYAWSSVVSKGTLKRIATAIRALPIPAAQPAPRRSEAEIRAIIRQYEITHGNIAPTDTVSDAWFRGALAMLRWVLNEQETGK